MKKLMIPVKEEECFIKELNKDEVEKIEAGGYFSCFFLKRCLCFKAAAEMQMKYLTCKKYYPVA